MANIYDSANNWVQTLIDSSLQNQPYDQTILCKIENIDSSSIGRYVVSYNSVTFDAFTDNDKKYKINDNVYVLIPQGNYDEQKIILCKKR